MIWYVTCLIYGAMVGDMRRPEDRLQNRCYELRSVVALIQSFGEQLPLGYPGFYSVAAFYTLFAI